MEPIKFQEIANQFKFDFQTGQVKTANSPEGDDLIKRACHVQEKIASLLASPEVFDEESIVFQVLKSYE